MIMIILSGVIPTFTLKVKVDFHSTCRLRSILYLLQWLLFYFWRYSNRYYKLACSTSIHKVFSKTSTAGKLNIIISRVSCSLKFRCTSGPSYRILFYVWYFGFDMHRVGREIVHTVSIVWLVNFCIKAATIPKQSTMQVFWLSSHFLNLAIS